MKVSILNRRISQKIKHRIRRKLRIRKKLSGTSSIPRLSFFRSNKNFYIQLIDDKIGNTICSISTYNKEFENLKPNSESAKIIAKAFAKLLKTKSITRVVFDRNGYLYHGVLKAFVDSMREEGIIV